MDEKWACTTCQSVNDAGAKACYKCGATSDNQVPLSPSTNVAIPEVSIAAAVPIETRTQLRLPSFDRLRVTPRQLTQVVALLAVGFVAGTAFVFAQTGPPANVSVGAGPSPGVSVPPSASSPARPREVAMALSGPLRARISKIAGGWYCHPTRARFNVRLARKMVTISAQFSHDYGRWLVTVVAKPLGERATDRSRWVVWRWDGEAGAVMPTPARLTFDHLSLRSASSPGTLRANGWIQCTGVHKADPAQG